MSTLNQLFKSSNYGHAAGVAENIASLSTMHPPHKVRLAKIKNFVRKRNNRLRAQG